MKTTFTATAQSNTWEIVPTNGFAGALFFIFLVYMIVRHFLFLIMIAEAFLSWLRKFRWFPSKGKRLKTFIHWLVAIGGLGGYLVLASKIGWIIFVPI